jgi:hypothetical protein
MLINLFAPIPVAFKKTFVRSLHTAMMVLGIGPLFRANVGDRAAFYEQAH